MREVGVDSSRVPGVEDAYPAWEDAAVPPEQVGNYLREYCKIVTKHGYRSTTFGHFGDGCIHCRLTIDVKTADGVKSFRSFMNEAADLVVRFGGSLSGEHGDGQLRAELLPKMYGPEIIQAFREFKSIWDPNWRMNSAKLIDPYKLDENLRVGPDYRPRTAFTHFKFPDDNGSIAQATERCFGVGRCRALEGATMCPSFMVTPEERYTTRGRAHLLFEMLCGDSILDGWRDEHVKEALDLCLSCKGCKGNCPVSVDIATYKSEFLSHYWEGRLRPRTAYALGWVDVWLRAASRAPGFANLVTQMPVLRGLAKAAAGIAPQCSIPAIALAAAEVLETAGFAVSIPQQSLCCGRPLYDFGMLDRAEQYLRRTLVALRDDIAAGTPVIILEPSCAAVFRDEMPNLLAHDEDVKRLSRQTFLLSEFLQHRAPDFQPPELKAKALVHGHCHQKSVMKLDPDTDMLKKLGIDFEVLESGCCGMAGSFGFEKEKYGISVACGERVLLPEIRKADASTLIIANGFSCQEQIAQLTDRRALHLAQVLQMSLHREVLNGSARPEEQVYRIRDADVRASMRRTAAVLAGGAVLGGAAWLLRKRRAA